LDLEVIFFALDATVDVEIHGPKQAKGFFLIEGFDTRGVVGMIE
jgi:hypothetical protein